MSISSTVTPDKPQQSLVHKETHHTAGRRDLRPGARDDFHGDLFRGALPCRKRDFYDKVRAVEEGAPAERAEAFPARQAYRRR